MKSKEESTLDKESTSYSEFERRWLLAVEEVKESGFTQEQAEYLVELRSKIESI
jgi:hypothetical protein